METLFSLFQSFLYEIDFFKTPFYFIINAKRNKISTRLGSIFSMIIIIVLGYTFFSSDMILKRNPSVISQTKTVDIPPRFEFDTSNFQVNFQIFDKKFKSHPIDPSIFNIYVKVVHFSYNNQNEIELKLSDIDFSQCNNTFGLLTYCIQSPIVIEGYPYRGLNGSFFVLDVMMCDKNSTNNCKGDEVLQNFFLDKGIFINYTNNNFDFDDYEKPIHVSSTSDNVWLDFNTSKYLNVFIKKTQFYDDYSPIFGSPILTETFERDYSSIDFSKGVAVNRSEGALAEIFVWPSNTIQQHRRTYQKIDKVLGSLAGVFNLSVFIMFWLVGIQNYLKINKFMIENLYEIEEDCNEKKKKKLFQGLTMINHHENKNLPSISKGQEKTIIEMNSNSGFIKIILFLIFLKGVKIIKINEKTHEDNFILERYSQEIQSTEREMKKSEKYENKSKILKINSIQYIWIKLKEVFNIPLRKWEILFEKCEAECLSRIRLENVFRGLQEVEKLKAVIFNAEQLNLFNLLPNPTIITNEEKNEVSTPHIHLKYESEDEKVMKACQYYDSVKRNNKKINFIDERLFYSLDKNSNNFH